MKVKASHLFWSKIPDQAEGGESDIYWGRVVTNEINLTRKPNELQLPSQYNKEWVYIANTTVHTRFIILLAPQILRTNTLSTWMHVLHLIWNNFFFYFFALLTVVFSFIYTVSAKFKCNTVSVFPVVNCITPDTHVDTVLYGQQKRNNYKKRKGLEGQFSLKMMQRGHIILFSLMTTYNANKVYWFIFCIKKLSLPENFQPVLSKHKINIYIW